MDKTGAKYRIINTFLLLYSPGDFSSASLPYYLYFLRTFLLFYNNQSTDILVCANQALCACQSELK